jgi:hypothetical protein
MPDGSAVYHRQGNWGNALMAYGSLKRRYLDVLREGPPPASYEEDAAARAAEQQLIGGVAIPPVLC